MSLISFSEVGKFYGQHDVLSGVTLSINAGEKVGLVGRNGAGKTTIIRLIMERERPDEGSVTRAKGLRLGYLPQEILACGGQSLLDTVMDTAEEYRQVEAELAQVNAELAAGRETLGERELMELADRQGHLMHLFESLGGWEKEAEAKKILSGLGFGEADFGRPLTEFSGGWIMRGILARLLLASPDILILDEPTNHLDIDSLVWLEGYLKESPSSLLLVSHDRVFLNNVVKKVIEVRQGHAHTYQGNYDQFLAEKASRLATEEAAFENQQARIKQIETFIERNRVRATTARRAQSRIKMLDKMERLDAPERFDDDTFSFRLPKPARGPDVVAEFKGAAKSYGDTVVYTDLNLQLRRGERLALIGPNGRGKSTLLKMLAGLEPLTGGALKVGGGVNLGYFAQFQMDNLNPANTVLEELATCAGDLGPGTLRGILGGFMFPGEDVFKKVTVLSGGEKARLALAKIMMGAPNLLLLDEPTNHLDIPGRERLETALKGYAGTMVLISHDRHFINALCNKTGVIENGRLEVYPGDYHDYQTMWRKEEAQPQRNRPAPALGGNDAPPSPEAAETSRKEARRREAEARKELAAKKRPLVKKMEEAEARLAAIEARQGEITALLADPATYQDQARAKGLNVELAALADEAKALEKAWEEAGTALESL